MKIYLHALTNLQDARYCAAMGIDYTGFSLERGSDRKLSAPMVWNIVQWLTGPDVVLHLNADSLEELAEARTSIPAAHITLPVADAAVALSVAEPERLILLCTPADAVDAASLLSHYPGLRLQFSVADPSELPADLPGSQLIVHFTDRDALKAYWRERQGVVAGIALGQEVLDATGELDYEFLDELL